MERLRVATPDDAYAHVGDVLREAVHAAWSDGRAAHVVLSGGRSGAELGKRLAALVDEEPSHALHLWIADERFVAPDDGDRNDTPIIAALGDATVRVAVHRHLPPGHVSLAQSAEEYASHLHALGDLPFDVVVLSMGEDGHVASVFPQHLQFPELAYAEPDSPKPPAQRTTISLARLANTRQCVVLALGVSKHEAVRAAEAGDMSLPVVQLAATAPVVLVTA